MTEDSKPAPGKASEKQQPGKQPEPDKQPEPGKQPEPSNSLSRVNSLSLRKKPQTPYPVFSAQ